MAAAQEATSPGAATATPAGEPRPFRVELDSRKVADMKARLRNARWGPDRVADAAPWSMGTEHEALRELVDYFASVCARVESGWLD